MLMTVAEVLTTRWVSTVCRALEQCYWTKQNQQTANT